MDKKLTDSGQSLADSKELRQRAEKKAGTLKQTSSSSSATEEVERLLHELTVHQIELEMQNEALRKSQADIEAARARYSDLYDRAPVGYCTINEKGIILETNMTLGKMLGVSRKVMIDTPFTSYILHEDQDQFYFHRKEMNETGMKQPCEFRMVRSDNNTFWVSLQSSTITAEDKSNFLRITVSDCTIQKTAQQEQQESEEKMLEYAQLLEMKNVELGMVAKEADQANQAKSRYLAHMNHEIRTPLSGFIGYLQLMEDTGLDKEQKEFMYYIRQSTSHMLSIINNVLDYAKIEAGKMFLVNCDFTLEQEIAIAMAPLRSLARQKDIKLTLTIDKNLPTQVFGDPDRFRQIILNLGGNAVKFTQKGHVHLAFTCPEDVQSDHNVQLVVEDSGSGMTQDTMKNLFLPFYQGDDGTIRQSKGTGLGMAITWELVERMNGEIDVKSTLGKGTRVTVLLKLNRLRA